MLWARFLRDFGKRCSLAWVTRPGPSTLGPLQARKVHIYCKKENYHHVRTQSYMFFFESFVPIIRIFLLKEEESRIKQNSAQ